MEFLEALDQGMVPWFQAHRLGWLNRSVIALTRWGDSPILLAVTLGGMALFAAGRRLTTAALFGTTALAALLTDRGFKYLVNRPRPEVAWPLVPMPDLPSFPSGHALISTAIYLSLALLIAGRLRRAWPGYLLVAASLLLAFLIGLSRLYLGVHYITDVVAGWAAGFALALTCRVLDDRLRGKEPLAA